MIARRHTPLLQQALAQFPATLLTGARQAGKTTLARHVWPRANYASLDDPALAAQARLTPEAFLAAQRDPLILDEVQYVPELLRHLKRTIDRDRRPGRYLLTGSQVFGLMAGVSESLAGRVAVLQLPTLAFDEVYRAPSRDDLDRFLWRGGFPELWARAELSRDLWMGSYVATYLERDVRQAIHVGDLRDFDRLLRAAALRVGQLLSYADLARDVGVAPNTARRWLSVLQASQQLFLLEPYHRQRAKRLIKAPKLYFNDTGLLCYLLGFRDLDALRAHAMWGAVWENFVIAETRKRAQSRLRPPALWFWRTAQGDEVDLLVETGPVEFVAVEIKTVERAGDAHLRGLRKLVAEYGRRAVREGIVVCRTPTAYPLPSESVPFRAVPLSELPV